MDKNLTPNFVILNNNLTEKEAFDLEKKYISIIGRIENGGSLTNLSDGGEGQSGFKFSDETKSKMSKDRTGKGNSMYGKKHSDESKLNISLSKIGKASPNKGKKLEDIVGKEKSDEIKKTMSDKASLRTGEKNSMYGKKHSDESKLKMSVNKEKKFGKDNPNFGRVYSEDEKTFDTWEITHEDGRTLEVENLTKFCKENNLNPSCMRDIYYGRMKKHRGWIKVDKLTDNVKKKK